MALNPTWGSMDAQFQRYRPRVATRQQLGLNPMGAPEGYYVYGKGDQLVEYTCDIEMMRTGETLAEKARILGLQLLCPRCSGPMHIRGPHLPGGREIIVHWDKMTASTQEPGVVRPLVTVVGAFSCDYLDSETNGIVAPKHAQIRTGKCGWRGSLDTGRLYDDPLQIHRATR